MFGLSEIAILLVVVIVLLGIKKLPELTRSAGKAARILKSEAKAAKDEGEPQAVYQVTRVQPTPAAPPQPGPAAAPHPGTDTTGR
ncbi:twin-arginine translocase TatA/TatE family subunit [Streptomyces sp. NPDC001941]|uniref:twin-arginine translocase TatA/TatE family subunit n=1 Tax=Streptomyces sp. NPDC001941 TaxID=3154659 RepID=UPI00331FE894